MTAAAAQTPFLITGLPRSRTAWLSAVTTTESSRCAHEPTQRFQSFEEFAAWWCAPWPFRAGVADHALGFQIERIQREIRPRVLIVERPFGEALESFERYMAGITIDVIAVVDFMTKLYLKLAAAQGPMVRRISYADLSRIEPTREALEWLVPGIDTLGLEDALGIKIQADRDDVIAAVRQPHSHWYLK